MSVAFAVVLPLWGCKKKQAAYSQLLTKPRKSNKGKVKERPTRTNLAWLNNLALLKRIEVVLDMGNGAFFDRLVAEEGVTVYNNRTLGLGLWRCNIMRCRSRSR